MKPVIIGGAALYHGDSEEIAPTITIADCLITDPPYGIDFAHGGNDNSGIGKGKYKTKFAGEKIIGDNKPFDPAYLIALSLPSVMWGGNHFADKLPGSSAWFVWDKRAASGHRNDFADCEIAWTNLGTVARMFRHHWDGMMKASERGEPRYHPTQKPIALMAWCIEQLKTAECILDPYMGSGTTGVAAIGLGRQFIGIERDERYFEIACRRIEQAVSQGQLFAPPVAKQEQASLL